VRCDVENDFRVGDLVKVKFPYGAHPEVPGGTILQLIRAGVDPEVWHTLIFPTSTRVSYVHFKALELYWRPDADAERLPDTGG
jgi:hypothetical protein